MPVKKIMLLLLLFLISCRGKETEQVNGSYYTCSMHPEIREKKPGKCPICKMPLTLVKKEALQHDEELILTDRQIQLGNIKTDSLKEHLIGEEVLLTGIITVNENNLTNISSRIDGRIEKLYHKSTGEYISSDNLLYEINSDELNSTIREFFLAKTKQEANNSGVDYSVILQAVKNRLLLYGLTENQINQLQQSRTDSFTAKILSKSNGVIYSVDIKEGDYVMEGQLLFRLADYSSVWAEAQVYSDYITEIREGMEATVTVPAYPDKKLHGKISFINPELSPSSKVNLVRIELPDPKQQLKPGMQAYISVTLNQKKTIALPTEAILRDSKGATVWIQTAPGRFKSVMIHTGIEAGDYTEVLHGLNKGTLVVVSGAYLLNSEYIFRKGSNPMEGHDMGNM